VRTKFTTIADARHYIRAWVKRYDDRSDITEVQINRAALALVDYVDTYGSMFDLDDDNSFPNTHYFDIDAYIYGRR